MGERAGRTELWEKSLVDGREAPIMTDDYFRGYRTVVSRWHASCILARKNPPTGEGQIMEWSVESRIEEPLTASKEGYCIGMGLVMGRQKTSGIAKRQ